MDPIISKLVGGLDFKIPGIDGAGAAGQSGTGTSIGGDSGGGGGFGKTLENAMSNLSGSMNDATTASQQLATGQAADVSQVAMTVERAVLELQMATQIRNKAVEAYQDIYRMQV
ncbi:MAG: flagellar hook-basal body complex protein FliE [Chloroflexota bacterium]